jgi:hypothetical protein
LDHFPDSALEVALRVALPGAIDLGASPAIERLSVEPMPASESTGGEDEH